MQPKYAIIISTADRAPYRDYLASTLDGLMESGVFESIIPHRFIVVDTGKGVLQRARAAIWFASHGIPVEILTPARTGSSPDNAARGLVAAHAGQSDWAIFLEDDIEPCGSFLESVDAWLRDNADPKVPLYPLCANYGKKDGREREAKAWRYGLGAFYGTQAYAIRGSDCPGAAEFLEREATARGQHNGHDLLLRDWVLERYPETTHLLVPGMDFVQHVGRESAIHPGRFHLYPHFGGPNWVYQDSKRTYYSPTELQRSRFSPNLARLLCQTLDKSLPVYDMGCGIGRYLTWMAKDDFVAMGIEGHPQAPGVAETTNVVSWDLSEPLPERITSMPRGSVVSLEVGEHIHADRSDVFLDNLVRMCDRTLILSWAVRGQGGLRHVNELNADELVPRVEARGFRLNVPKTDEWRSLAGTDLFWFKQSIYCFERHAE